LKQKRREEDILFLEKKLVRKWVVFLIATYGGMVVSEVANKITESAIPVL
jgi:hypothetical protein